MMRRFLTVSTITVLSNFGMMNLVHAGLFKQPHQAVAALPKHNIIVAQAEIPADPIYANTPTAPATTDTPPLPTFAVTPTTTTTADTPTLSTATENTAPTNTSPAENSPSIPAPSEESSTRAVQQEIIPTPTPPNTTDPILEPTQMKAQQVKTLPAPTKTPAKAKKLKHCLRQAICPLSSSKILGCTNTIIT